MATDDRLRLTAEVADQASVPLRKISGELQKIKSHPGLTQATADLMKLQNVVKDLSGSAGIGGGLLTGIGLGGGFVAGVAGAVASLDKLAKRTLEMKHLGRETGIGEQDIRAFQAVGRRFQIEQDQMTSGLQNWATKMAEFKRRDGSLYNELGHENPILRDQIFNEQDAKKSLGLYLNFLSQIRSAQGQKQWADLGGLGGWERLFVDGAEKFKAAWLDVVTHMSRTTPEAKKAAAELEERINKLNEAVDRLMVNRGGVVLGWLTAGLDLVDATIKRRVAELEGYLDKLEKLRALMGSAPDAALSPSELLKRKQGALHDIETTIRAKESAPTGDRDTTVERGVRDKLVEEIRKLSAILEKATAQQSSLQESGAAGGTLTSMIQKAALSYGAGGGGGGGGESVAFGMRGRVRFGGGGRGDGSVSDDGPRIAGQGAVSGGAKERGLRAMARLVAHGWTPAAAATAIGQATEESGVRSDGPLGDTRRFGTGDKAAHGMFQWRDDRYRALKKFAEGRGKPWTDFDTQVDFFDAERRGRGALERGWHRETDLRRGNAIGKHFEGYDGPLQQQRLGHARRLLDEWERRKPAIPTEEQAGARPGSLSDAAKAAGVGRHTPLQVNTNGSVDMSITLDSNGRPVATRIKSDGIVGGIKLNRGGAMPVASDQA